MKSARKKIVLFKLLQCNACVLQQGREQHDYVANRIVYKPVYTLRSGMLNLWLVERLLVRVVAAIILSHVCWQVLSPGAEINQNSVIFPTLVQLLKTREESQTQTSVCCIIISLTIQ